MIAADRNMLKASLTRGILEIQLNLVNLYTSNLNAIATQAALVAGFAFTGIAETTYPGHGVVPLTLGYFYYFFDTLCLVSGLFAVSQATIVTLYGPAMALSGETPEAVTRSVVLMRDQQDFVFKVGEVSDFVFCDLILIRRCVYHFALPRCVLLILGKASLWRSAR